MEKKVMVLGAGIFQVPLINRIKEMGHKAIVVSRNGKYPGINLGDIFLDIDTTDSQNILLAAKHYKIDGIVTTGTDVSIPAIGTVVDALGSRGPSRKIADIVSSKICFRSFLLKNNFNCPEFACCDNAQEVWNFYKRLNNKMVVKPDDSSGSRGVIILNHGLSKDEVMEAYNNSVKYARNGRVCAEAFLDGIEVGGDAFLLNGNIQYFAITSKHMNGVIVQGHSLPGALSKEKRLLVKKEISKIASQLGYENGPLNFDVMINNKKPTVIEIGLRNGGNGIIDIICHSEGFNLIDWLLAFVLGEPIPEKNNHKVKACSSYVFGSNCKGILESVSNLEELSLEVPEVFKIVLAKEPGDLVDVFINNSDLIGYLLIYCGFKDYKKIILKIQETLKVKVLI